MGVRFSLLARVLGVLVLLGGLVTVAPARGAEALVAPAAAGVRLSAYAGLRSRDARFARTFGGLRREAGRALGVIEAPRGPPPRDAP